MRAISTTIQDALNASLQQANTKYSQDEYKINEKRYFETLKLLTTNVPTKSSVLEVGCAPGLVTTALCHLGYFVQAIDIDPEGCLESARSKVLIQKCDLDIDQLPFDNDTFDCILFTEVIEHLHPFRSVTVLKEIHRCLKKKGVLILSTPNLFALENRLFMLFGGTSALGGGITPTHHTREYGMKEIINMLQNSNFNVDSKYYSDSRDLVTVGEMWKNIGRKIVYPIKKIVPSFRSCIFVAATK